MIDRRTPLAKADPTVFQLSRREVERQEHGLELIASENFVSVAVLEAMGTALTNKYAEGLPKKRYYGGCEVVDEVEQLAIDRAKALFKAEHVNVQPHAGAQANMAAYLAVAKPGDTLLGLALPHGGHLTHGAPVNFSGTLFRATHYGVREDTGWIDYDQVREIARRERPRILIGGSSAYARIIDFAMLKRIADEVGAIFVVDMAHIAGLVAAGIHPSPVPHAQIVTTTTHKTLRGPRGGLILCQEVFAKDVDKQGFPGIQGGALEHGIAAKSVALGEALTPEFKAYAVQVVRNAQALAAALVERGYAIVSGGTDTHLMLVDLRSKHVTGKEAQELLDRAGITVNKNTIPGDPQKAFVTSGVRIGTPAVTTRGFTEAEMLKVAEFIDTVLTKKDDATIARVKAEVRELAGRFPLYAPPPPVRAARAGVPHARQRSVRASLPPPRAGRSREHSGDLRAGFPRGPVGEAPDPTVRPTIGAGTVSGSPARPAARPDRRLPARRAAHGAHRSARRPADRRGGAGEQTPAARRGAAAGRHRAARGRRDARPGRRAVRGGDARHRGAHAQTGRRLGARHGAGARAGAARRGDPRRALAGGGLRAAPQHGARGCAHRSPEAHRARPVLPRDRHRPLPGGGAARGPGRHHRGRQTSRLRGREPGPGPPGQGRAAGDRRRDPPPRAARRVARPGAAGARSRQSDPGEGAHAPRSEIGRA